MADLSDKARNLIASVLAVILVTLLLYNHFRQDSDAEEKFEIESSSTLSRAGLNLVSSSNSDEGALAKALALLDQAIKADPKDPVALFGLGWALQLQKKSDLAIARYNEGLFELNELAKFSLYNRSFIKEESGDIAGALADVKACLAIVPDFAAAQTRESQLQARVVSRLP